MAVVTVAETALERPGRAMVVVAAAVAVMVAEVETLAWAVETVGTATVGRAKAMEAVTVAVGAATEAAVVAAATGHGR